MRNFSRRQFSGTLLLAGAALATGCKTEARKSGNLRLGHFPNITHAQAVIANLWSRQGKPWFEPRIGEKVEWSVYNAGPSAIEAMFAGSVDITYVGPNPVLNGYTKTKGDEVRVIAGSTAGGAALVVQGDGPLKTPADFRGKVVATPQFGNTQDVAARVWLKKQGYKVTQTGGDVKVVPTENPNQIVLFQKKELDAVWTVEPWVSRLEVEAGGRVFLEQKDDFATVVAASTEVLKERAELVKKFAAAHAELTEWVKKNTDEAKALVREGLKVLTTRELPKEVIDKAWPRLVFDTKVTRDQFERAVKEAQSVDFLQDAPPLDRLLAIPG